MAVTSASPNRHEHEGRAYYFCSEKCRAKFAADPTKYLTPGPSVAAKELGAVYVCPMHPEIRRDEPGNCPKCGMALEPELPSLDDEENPELVDFRRRFWWTLPLTVVVTVLAMFGHRLGFFDMATQTWSGKPGAGRGFPAIAGKHHFARRAAGSTFGQPAAFVGSGHATTAKRTAAAAER